MAKPTSLEFFADLRWLDGRPLLDTIEPYRRQIFVQALDDRRPDGSPAHNLVLCGRAKKNFKTSDMILAAIFTMMVRGDSPQGATCYIVASGEDQASDDLALAKAIVAANPELQTELEILVSEIKRRDGRGTLRILPARNVAGMHGKTFAFCGIDEAHTMKNWDVLEAMAQDPTRPYALTWITSYDALDSVAGMPLYDLKKIGLEGSDPKMLFSWYSADFTTDPEFVQADPELRANPSMESWPEGREYLEQQRRRLPSNKFKRLHLNLPTSSEDSFVDVSDWNACINAEWKPPVSDFNLSIWVGLDIGFRSDATAIVAVTWDRQAKQVKVVSSQVFYPQPHEPLNIDGLVPFQIGKLRSKYKLRSVHFDPWQAIALAQRLSRSGINMIECQQTPGFLTELTGNLLNLIRHRSLVALDDQEMRLAITRAAVTETGRGVRIVKGATEAKIDSVIALALACWGAVTEGEAVEPSAMTFASPIITTKHRDTGQVAVYGAPHDPQGPPAHWIKSGQPAEPWRNLDR